MAQLRKLVTNGIDALLQPCARTEAAGRSWLVNAIFVGALLAEAVLCLAIIIRIPCTCGSSPSLRSWPARCLKMLRLENCSLFNCHSNHGDLARNSSHGMPRSFKYCVSKQVTLPHQANHIVVTAQLTVAVPKNDRAAGPLQQTRR